jgi:hypothetical protein
MNALLATYLAFSYLPSEGAASLLPGFHHSPVPYLAHHSPGDCSTGWGERYPQGAEIQLGALELQCDYVATWIDGEYQGKSMRWMVSAH